MLNPLPQHPQLESEHNQFKKTLLETRLLFILRMCCFAYAKPDATLPNGYLGWLVGVLATWFLCDYLFLKFTENTMLLMQATFFFKFGISTNLLKNGNSWCPSRKCIQKFARLREIRFSCVNKTIFSVGSIRKICNTTAMHDSHTNNKKFSYYLKFTYCE